MTLAKRLARERALNESGNDPGCDNRLSKAPALKVSRRSVLAFGTGATLSTLLVGGFRQSRASGPALRHAHSPLGTIKYPPGFGAFDYVDPAAPRGGTLRLARIGGFDTANTLTYPGRPPADIRLIYDRLIVASDDERATYYGALAAGLDVSDDFTRIVMALQPDARWHDGRPVRARDVVFTFDTLKAEGAPFYRQAFLPLRVTADGEDRVVFENDRVGDRDVMRQIATIPVHPAPGDDGSLATAQDGLPLGSGPYRVALFDPPRRLALERVADWWGQNLPVNVGRWNADRLEFEYFRDDTVALEAFHADIYDLRFESNPTQWRTGYDSPAVATGSIRRSEAQGGGVGSLHGLVFNQRRPMLADRRARLALALAYDFETVNRTLFGGAQLRFDSVFGDTDLAATGQASAEERALLSATLVTLPHETLVSADPFDGRPPAGGREALMEAARLLDEAGYPVRDGRLVDPATNRPVELRVISTNPLYERALGWIEQAWDRLGIRLVQVQTDSASAARQMLDRDFDLATLSWSPAPLPGTAERLLWHGDLAEQAGSYALSGIRNPALDATIEALGRARSEADLQTAGRAFDRVFRQLLPLLPLWRSNTIRLAWWDRFGRPMAEQNGLPPSPIDRWWVLEA
ncbi:MAG: extracellular solute-binding protein [Pseudomonadota bacterium]